MNINTLSTLEKRQLVNQLRAAIKEDTLQAKLNKASLKQAKEIEKKQKIQNAIKAAQDKLARLQAKLA